MLGLTIPDAIAFGSLCTALLAAYAGLFRGDRVAPDRSPNFIGDMRAHAAAIVELAGSVAELAAAIRSAASAEATREQYTGAVEAIMRRLDERSQNRMR